MAARYPLKEYTAAPKGGLSLDAAIKHVLTARCLAGAHAMAERSEAERTLVLLVKWRFVPDKKGDAGEAKYWWSDGSKTKEPIASHVDAVNRLKVIQDGGGLKNSLTKG